MARGKGIRMPSTSEVPEGAHRRLLEEIFYMFGEAGRPTLRAIVAQANQMDLKGTASQETIRRVLKGISVPERWGTLYAIYAPLCAMANVDPNALYEEPGDDEYNQSWPFRPQARLKELWRAALDGDEVPMRSRTKVEIRPSGTPAPPAGGFGSFSPEPPF